MRKIACIFGFHSWNGCKCTRCEAIRDKEHRWDEFNCSQCGKASPEEEARFLRATAEGRYDDVETRVKLSPGLALVRDSHGNTPLHLAAAGDHVLIARLVISHGADIDAQNLDGDTPLHVATKRDHTIITQFLLDQKSYMNFTNYQGNTPLLIAARNDNHCAGRLLAEATEAAVLTSIKIVTKDESFGLPPKWDDDSVVREALSVAKAAGSHRMAACLHRAKAGIHRAKGELLTKRANGFVRLHNSAAAESGGAGGLHRRFATEEAQAAQEEYHLAREENRAAERELALSLNANERATGPLPAAERDTESQFKIWKTIKLGTGIKDGDGFRRTIKGFGHIDNWANGQLDDSSFRTAAKEIEVDLVNVSVGQLGFSDGGNLADIYGKAMELGLKLCPNEVGPQLRLQYKDQPMDEWLRIGMEPIIDPDGSPAVFTVGCNRAYSEKWWLRGGSGRPDYGFDPFTQFVFVLPRKG